MILKFLGKNLLSDIYKIFISFGCLDNFFHQYGQKNSSDDFLVKTCSASFSSDPTGWVMSNPSYQFINPLLYGEKLVWQVFNERYRLKNLSDWFLFSSRWLYDNPMHWFVNPLLRRKLVWQVFNATLPFEKPVGLNFSRLFILLATFNTI